MPPAVITASRTISTQAAVTGNAYDKVEPNLPITVTGRSTTWLTRPCRQPIRVPGFGVCIEFSGLRNGIVTMMSFQRVTTAGINITFGVGLYFECPITEKN